MFGKNKQSLDNVQHTLNVQDRPPVFIEFRGAMANIDDDTMKVEFTPRDLIAVNACRISGYYDHTILIEGRKIRVMDTYAQIAVKIMEAMR